MKRNSKYRKRNPNINIFDIGGWTKEITNPDGSKSTVLTGAGKAAIGSQIMNIGSGVLAGGNETGVGNFMKSIGNVANIIPGPYGQFISGGLGTLGNIFNATLGSSLNQDFIDSKNREIATVAGSGSDAVNAQDFMDDWASRRAVGSFSKSDVGSDGLFSNKASNTYNGMIQAAGVANQTQTRNYLSQADYINRRSSNSLLGQLKAFGGALSGNGANWTNGITVIGNGGTHEQNPFEGVQMGVAPDGKPNLVEEGELVWKDYVFSRRIKVPQKLKERYKLRGEDLTFADAAKYMQKSSAERPNDPIAKRTVETNLGALMMEQEYIRQARQARRQDRMFAEGGGIYIKPSKRGTFTAAASKHGMGVQEFASRVLANKDDYSPAMVKKANFARNASKWKHADGGLLGYRYDGLGGMPNSLNYNLSAPTLPFSLGRFKYRNMPELKMPKLDWSLTGKNTFSMSPEEFFRMGTSSKTTTPITPITPITSTQPYKGSKLTALRYVPALGAAVGVATDLLGLTNRPDYSNVDTITDAVNSAISRAGGDVSYTPVGEYLQYNPFDRLFYANQLVSNADSTRRALANSANGNVGAVMSGLLSLDRNTIEGLGKMYRQGEEFNLGQRERTATFNRATDMFNAEQDLEAQIANRERGLKEAQILAGAAEKTAAMRDAIEARASAARSANLTNLFESLGNIGIDAYNRQDRDMLIKAGIFGTLSQKPQEWSQKRWEDYQKTVSGKGYRNGGILRKRKGITI